MLRFMSVVCALVVLASFRPAAAQFITTPNCPNGLCPRLQQAIPAAFPAQPLIQFGMPAAQPAPLQSQSFNLPAVPGVWNDPKVTQWHFAVPAPTPGPMPGPAPTPSPNPSPIPSPVPTPGPSPEPAPTPCPCPVQKKCQPLIFPNFQPFGGALRPCNWFGCK